MITLKTSRKNCLLNSLIKKNMSEKLNFVFFGTPDVASLTLDILKQAALALEKLLVSHGVTEDELFQEFRALREGQE